MLNIIIIIIIIIIVLFILINRNKQKIFLLKEVYEHGIDYLTQNHDTYCDLYNSACVYRYKAIVNKTDDVVILINILNTKVLNTNFRWYKEIGIPKTICQALFYLNSNNIRLDSYIIKDLFITFKEWVPDPFRKSDKTKEIDLFIYDKCIFYIIMIKLNYYLDLFIHFDKNLYEDITFVFTKDPIILSCKIMSESDGIYSDGSIMYESIPSIMKTGNMILDNFLYSKYILKINTNQKTINTLINIIISELNFYGAFSNYNQYFQTVKLICQLGYCHEKYINTITDTRYLIKSLCKYNLYINETNLEPTLKKHISYKIDDNIKFTILTVNGIVRVMKNGFGITSSNYTGFCYKNETDLISRCCIKLVDPNIHNYYYQSDKNNKIAYNIQNILLTTHQYLAIPVTRNHSILGYQLDNTNLFVAKGFTFEYGRLQAYEILSFNGIISVNHIKFNRHINKVSLIIFMWKKTKFQLNNGKELYIENNIIQCSESIYVFEENNYLIFHTSVYDPKLDIVIAFSINKSLNDIKIRPSNDIVCTGLMEIRERLENEYMNKYNFYPKDFDPSKNQYFELSSHNLGFILASPYDNIATNINDKDVIIYDNGVRFIYL